MSAQDNLGRQFITLYRGIQTHPKKINKEQLGMHWTTSKDVAEGAALGMYPDDLAFDQSLHTPPRHSAILEAKIPKSEIIKRGTVEHKELSEIHEIMPYAREREKTIRPGTPVDAKVHQMVYGRRGMKKRVQKRSLRGNV